MPKKPTLTNDEGIVKLYREFLKLVDPQELTIADNLEGDELRDFLKFCHQTFHHQYFDRIVKGFIFDQVWMTAQAGITPEQYMNGKLMLAGIFALQEYLGKKALKYQVDHMTPAGDFDPTKSFEPAKINN